MSYRKNSLEEVIRNIPAERFSMYLPAVISIEEALKKKNRIIVAIDGRTASGKSTFVEWLSDYYDLNCYHMDDFYLTQDMRTEERLSEPGGNVDRERFDREVLLPLITQEEFSYGVYSCKEMNITTRVQVKRKALEIIEGAYSHHPDLVYAYDLKLVFSIDPKSQIDRLLMRGGVTSIDAFKTRWIPMEEKHLNENKVFHFTDVICYDLVKEMRAAKTEDAEAMAKYLKNKFTCLGLKKDERSKLAKVFIWATKKSKTINWNFVDYLWGLKEREFQYVALDYLDSLKGCLEADDIGRIGNLAIQNSWWDSVDGVAVNLVGSLLFRFKTEIEPVIREWAGHENMWLNRTSILSQLKFKQETDCELLEYVILKNHETKEFFLNKAIGWALREYSKTDPEWVAAFISNHQLHTLSIREASKYLSVNE